MCLRQSLSDNTYNAIWRDLTVMEKRKENKESSNLVFIALADLKVEYELI